MPVVLIDIVRHRMTAIQSQLAIRKGTNASISTSTSSQWKGLIAGTVRGTFKVGRRDTIQYNDSLHVQRPPLGRVDRLGSLTGTSHRPLALDVHR